MKSEIRIIENIIREKNRIKLKKISSPHLAPWRVLIPEQVASLIPCEKRERFFHDLRVIASRPSCRIVAARRGRDAVLCATRLTENRPVGCFPKSRMSPLLRRLASRTSLRQKRRPVAFLPRSPNELRSSA